MPQDYQDLLDGPILPEERAASQLHLKEKQLHLEEKWPLNIRLWVIIGLATAIWVLLLSIVLSLI